MTNGTPPRPNSASSAPSSSSGVASENEPLLISEPGDEVGASHPVFTRRVPVGAALALGALALALSAIYLMEGNHEQSRAHAAFLGGSLFILGFIAALVLLLAHTGRSFEGTVAELTKLNRDLQAENANRREGEKRHQQLAQGLRSIVEVTDELIALDDESELLCRAIELAREKLGVERCRLFLTSPDGQALQASFGTDGAGNTCDERQATVPVTVPWTDDPFVPRLDERWRHIENQPLWYCENGAWKTLCDGWLAATLVMAGKEPLGVFYHDTALSGAPYDPIQQEFIFVYCSLLGALIGRKRSEAHLLESQRHLQTVMQNAPLFLYTLDTKERFTLAMGAALSVLGLDAEKMLGSSLTDVLSEREASVEFIRRALGGETTYADLHFAGRHLQVLRQPTFDSEKRVVGMMGLGVDITERVEAEQALRSSQERYRSVVDSLNEVVFQTDTQGHWKFLNSSWTDILGWSIEESLGQLYTNFVHPEDRNLQEAFQPLVNGAQTSARRTRRYLTKSGQVRWLEVFARPALDENRQIIGTTGTLNDVTERHQTEEQLSATTALQNAILSGVSYAIVACDADGTIRLFNRAAEAMLGYRAFEIVGQNASWLLQRICDPAEITKAAHTLEKELGHTLDSEYSALIFNASQGLEDENEWTFIRHNATRFPGRLSISALRDAKDLVTGYVGIIYDVTENRRAEHLKNEFVSVVSHELRTPLTSIRGSLGLLAGGVAGQLPPAASQMIDIAQKNVERLVVLINDILDIEKIESGKMRFEMSELLLWDVMSAAAEQNQAYGETLNVHLKLEILPPGLEQRKIYGDEGRLMQVFSNLLSNAMKFSPPGRTVTLCAEARDGDQVRIKVSDEGDGVPKEFIPHLFERFSQAEAALTRTQGGTGLGLAIARAIVEKHEGHIGYLPPEATLKERGATFYFDLQLLPAAPAAKERPCVLVCEDDPEVARLIEILLESDGYRVEVAHTLAHTRELLASETPFYALMLDLLLPDGQGLDLIAELHAETPERDLPIIVVSAHCDEGKLCGSAFGINDWIEKPLDPSRVLGAISQVRHQGKSGGKPRLLHVEDDADIRQIIRLMLEDRAEVVSVSTLADARFSLTAQHFDIALLDIDLPDGSGLTLIPLLNAQDPPIPVVLFSADDEAENESGVLAALIKSRTSNLELRETVERLLPPA